MEANIGTWRKLREDESRDLSDACDSAWIGSQ